MADAAASDSESSDIVVEESDFESDLDDEMTADPLNRAQALGADEDGVAGTEQWVANLFADSDDSGDELEGFHVDWVTSADEFRQTNVPECTLDGGSTFQHPEETTAAYYFGLFWDDEVSIA